MLWCDRENNPTSWAGPLPSLDMVSEGRVFASPDMLRFRHPDSFVAGNLTSCLEQWNQISVGYEKREFVLTVIRDGVDVFDFFTPFNGTFQRKSYCSDVPPRMCYPNSLACLPFKEFITTTIMDRISNGSINVVGRVNEVEPPHLVMPITVEPNKPRMCHDERFLNCWTKDCPFKLDYLTDLCRYVDPGHYQTTFDDKSGYDHVRLHPRSSTFFGFQWEGWYFTYSSLPFGWKASAFVYNTVGLTATHYIRSLGVPCSQYIDDRHVGQLRLRSQANGEHVFSNFQLAQMAAFIACFVVISLGYFIGLKKSCLVPSTARRFLGYICDSERQAFPLPQDKKDQFAELREAILSRKSVSLKTLQKFAGKTTSFALLVPAAKLYSNSMYQAISRASKSASRQVKLSPALQKEISHWRFLDTWQGFLPWRNEAHLQVKLFSDASNFGWGGCLFIPDRPEVVTRGYWDEADRERPIIVKEIQAVRLTLENLLDRSANTRVDVFVDNKALVSSWENQVSKSPEVSGVMKSIFQFSLARNLSLSFQYVPSQSNPADSPSRTLSDLDASLDSQPWKLVDSTFGPHSIDLMALPSNVKLGRSGRPLKFFSPFPCVQAQGTNVFSQVLSPNENAYVFPPFTLIGPLLRYLASQPCPFTVVAPDVSPRRYWWPLLQRQATAAFKLGRKGDNSILLFPSKAGRTAWERRPLQWDLWVFRFASIL